MSTSRAARTVANRTSNQRIKIMEIKSLNGCTYVMGSIPVTDLVGLMNKAPRNSVIDAGLSSKIGASIVFGLPDDLKVFAANPEVLSMIEVKTQAVATQYGFDQQARQWLIDGETGSSSMAILHMAYEGGDKEEKSHPHDVSDLRRCRLLLEEVDQARDSFYGMAHVSTPWSNLVANWDEICQLMDEESPLWRQKTGSAKKTNDLIQSLISHN